MTAFATSTAREIHWNPIKKQLRDVIKCAPLMSWLCEPDGFCIYLNPRWSEFSGQRSEDALGLGWTDAIHPEDSGRALEIYVSSAALMLPYNAEYRIKTAAGSYEWVSSVAQPYFDELGHLQAMWARMQVVKRF